MSNDASVRDKEIWTDYNELADSLFFTVVLFLYRIRVLNWWTANIAVYPVATYYFLKAGDRRRVSREYFERLASRPAGKNALGHEPSLLDTYKHFLEFVRCVFDRGALWLGYDDHYEFSSRGRELFYSSLERDEGALIVSFHIGNHDFMRYMAMDRDITINIISYQENAAHLRNFLETVDAKSQHNVLNLDPSSPASVLQLNECIQRGEFVAALGDRVSVGARDRVTEVDFLGARAKLPQGPFIMADVLGCKVLNIYALRTGFTEYEINVETFAEEVNLSSRNRDADIQEYAQQYANTMEEVCFRAPYQWFNFFDFWK